MNAITSNSTYEFSTIAQYKTLISTIPVGIVIAASDENFTILSANQGYYDMVGYSREEHTAAFHNSGMATLHPEEALTAAISAREQLSQTGTFSITARLHHKFLGYIWGHFSAKLAAADDGTDQLYIVLVDVSEHQQTLEKLEKEKSFNELISLLSEECFFDCDLGADTVRYSKDFASQLGLYTLPTDCISALHQLGLLPVNYTEDQKDTFLLSLAKEVERELHFPLPDGSDIWYLCRYNVLTNSSGLPVRIVGKLIDITRHKIQIDELSHLAQHDQLTGLYNKTYTESLIKEIMKNRCKNDYQLALLIVDIDNFKDINDRLGHLYGDVVLTQLAEKLHSLFRSDDIVGRIGGDEFFVLMKNYTSTEILKKRANEICTVFHKTYSQGSTFVTISGSIGIALCPDHAVSFDSLYRKADAALYHSKASGKNTFSIYTDNLSPTYTSERTKIDHNILNKSFKDNRIEYVFRLLYNSVDTVSSIQSILQLLTESYGFSRGYIFETTADGYYTNNTFEWCINEVAPQIHNLQNLPAETTAVANRAFLESGMFIVKNIKHLPSADRSILEPQGILSMFQFGIIDNGKLRGFIGFDDCVRERIPTDTEIDELSTVCHVLGTFLLKYRTTT